VNLMVNDKTSIKFGVVLPTFCGGEYNEEPVALGELIDIARKAEKLELDSVWVVEHLLVASPRYKTTWMEPLTVLAAIASQTNKVRLGTSILILPLRNPVLVAKTVSTLDHLSSGRVVLGVGAGWHKGEFDAMNVSFSKRGRILDEQLEILRVLLSGEKVTYHGKFYNLDNIEIYPRPVQKPNIPIWIGGGGSGPNVKIEKVLKRIATFGDGWITRPTNDFENLSNWWKVICHYAADKGKDTSKMTFAHLNFISLREKDSDLMKEFSTIVNLSIDEVKRIYIVGGKTDIFRKIEKLISIGVNYFIAWLTGVDYITLEFIADELIPTFTN